MTTLKNNPNLMTVICNIQSMKIKVYPGYNMYDDFRKLKKMTDTELHKLQDNLIPLYNKSLKTIQ